MDVLSLDLVELDPSERWSTSLGVLINGERLESMARVVELPHAEAEGNAALAGSYSPLSLGAIGADPRHFLGSPVASWFEDGDTVLLGCTCGEWGCWPLTARIEVAPDVVTWRDFRHGHRDWDLRALGPFEFDRGQYERALGSITG